MDSKDEAEQAVDPRLAAIPDSHGHAKGEHKPFLEERPIPYTARMLFLWFYHACRRGSPRFMMVADHMNYLTFEDPAAVNLVRRALKLAQAGDLFGAAETAGVEVGHAEIVSKGLRRGMRYSIGAEVDNDPRSRPDAQNIVDAMKPDGMVRSVHFLPITHPTHGENWMWAFDNPEFKDLYEVVGTETVWEIYMATLLDAVEKLPGNIVGHFYVPAIFGHWPDDAVLEGYEDRLLDAVHERGMAIELNSRYVYKHYLGDEAQLEKFRAAHVRLLRKAKEKGVEIAVGSDAHSPKDQGRAFDAVLSILDEVEINEIAFPIGGRLARVALRATEEIMKQYAPPEPEPVAPPPAPEPVPETAAEAPAKVKKPRPSRSKAALAAAAEAAGAAAGIPPGTPDDADAEAETPAEMSDAPVEVAAEHAAASGPDDGIPEPETAVPDAEPESAPVKRTPPPRKKAAATSSENGAGPIASIVEAAKGVIAAAVHAIVPHSEPAAAPPPEAPSEPAASDAAPPKPVKAPAGKSVPAKAAAKAAPAAASKKSPPAKPAAKAPAKPPAKKPAAPAKKAAAKKPAAKKPVAKKKAAAAKPPVKKTASKPAAKKAASAKKAPAKKTAAKKAASKKAAPAKKTAAKKAAPKSAKRVTAKHAPAKKSPAKKPARRR